MQVQRPPSIVWASQYVELVRDELQLVEAEITKRSAAPVDSITSIGRYIHSSGGKRLRPALLLLAARLFGGGGQPAICLAAVMEMIHAATLIHDDVIDMADLRRGRPSINAVWGNQTSVLAGDWLYMQAFRAALELRNFQILDILIQLTQTMVEGEMIQLEKLGSAAVTEDEYLDLVHRKTAALFEACTRLGAMVSGAPADAQDLLAQYGWNLGMAFQLVDDVLDFTAQEAVLGKPVGNDLKEGKVTLPLIYVFQSASPLEIDFLKQVLESQDKRVRYMDRILHLIDKYNGIERSLLRARVFTHSATSLIELFPPSPYQRALRAIAKAVTDREK